MCKYYADLFEEKFVDYDKFLEKLSAEAGNTVFIRPKIAAMRAVPINIFEEGGLDGFSPTLTTIDAVIDSNGVGIAIEVEGEKIPLRNTAMVSLLARAGISGRSLELLSREELCEILNKCFALYEKESTQILVRDLKVGACHSAQYAYLPQDELVMTLKGVLNDKFPGNEFVGGYFCHGFSTAEFRMPKQREALLKSYLDKLYSRGYAVQARDLVPGVRFKTSDVSQSAARVSAYIYGGDRPMLVGSCLEVVHKGRKSGEFSDKMKMLFAKFTETIEDLEKLMDIEVYYPIATLKRVCKELGLPKAEALEAINMFEATMGGTITAYDMYAVMQEILFNCECSHFSFEKMLRVEENIARAIKINWRAYDLTKDFAW